MTSHTITVAPSSDACEPKLSPLTTASVIASISALMKKSAIPRVSRISGIERIITIGLTMKLTTPKTADASASAVQPDSRALPLAATAT